MKITLHLEGTKEEMAEQCLEFVKALAGTEAAETERAAPTPEAGKKKRGPKGKKEEPSEEEPEETNEEEESGQEAEEASDDDLGFEEEEEEAPEYTMDDLVKACQAFSKKKEGNKEKVKKLLKKHGVASVRDLKKPKFAEFMAALK